MEEMEREISKLWLDTEHRVASFHEIEDGQKMEFTEDGFYHAFLDGLVAVHYRFQ